MSPTSHTHTPTHTHVHRTGDATCAMPYVVNGVTFDLSSPTHVIRLPTAKKTSEAPANESSVAVATKRGQAHKEIERRRKLKITTAISQLESCLPFKILGRVVGTCLHTHTHTAHPPPTHTHTAHTHTQRHGDVLEGAINHIKKLTQENEELRGQSSSTESECLLVCSVLLYTAPCV